MVLRSGRPCAIAAPLPREGDIAYRRAHCLIAKNDLGFLISSGISWLLLNESDDLGNA